MAKKPQSSSVDQTTLGNDNTQVVGNNNVITRVTNFFSGDTEQRRAIRNRKAMLGLVKSTWIKGVLENSLYNEVLIELGMEEKPGVVDRPWDMQIQMPNQISRLLPHGTSMMNIFDEMNGAMLILGEPGSGKTTMLLDLARDCIARAEQDDNQPIPVIFNLSSWNNKQTIDDWLVNELVAKYNVSKKISKSWVINDDLQLLLDGLDEVKQEYRAECVKAINDFRQKHGLSVPIAVCSRIADYEYLPLKLNLQGAILLQPLKPQQIEGYFEQTGSELEGVCERIKNDEMLQELTKQPLMLSILTLAYRGMPAQTLEIEHSGTLEAWRRHLFDTYIQKMFERTARTRNFQFTKEQTLRSLSWLAAKMIEHGQSIFFVEMLKPSWLASDDEIRKSERTAAFISGGFLGFGAAFVLGKSSSYELGIFDWLFAIFLSTLAFSLFFGFSRIFFSTRKTIGILVWSWDYFNKSMLAYSRLIPGTALLMSMVSFLTGLMKLIKPLSLTGDAWSWDYGIRRTIMGLIVGALIFPFISMLQGIRYVDTESQIEPDRVIRQYLLNSIITGLTTALFSVLTLGIVTGITEGLTAGLKEGLEMGIFAGIMTALMFGGGNNIISHYVIRSSLFQTGSLPWNYLKFMHFGTEKIFLRKVGNGYIFIHRLLMEHFADIYPVGEK